MNSYSRNHWYITLLSNSSKSIYPSNSITSFKNVLAVPIDLNTESNWEVSLVDLYLPLNIPNITESVIIGFHVPCLRYNSTRSLYRSSDVEYLDAVESPTDNYTSRLSQTKNDVIMIGKEGCIEAGYYASVKEILQAIENLYNRLYHQYKTEERLIFDLYTSYQPYLKQAYMQAIPCNPSNSDSECQTPLSISSSSHDLLSKVLGFDDDSIECLEDSGLESYVGTEDSSQSVQYRVFVHYRNPLRSKKSCDLPLFKRLFIGCDLVDHQYIGESSAQILDSSVITTLDHRNGHHIINSKLSGRKHDIRSALGRIDTIQISLYSGIAPLTEFPIGLVSNDDQCDCTLHIMRKGAL